jgi:hypothetical protein
MKTRNIALVTLVLIIMGTFLSACGPSAEDVYAEKITAPVNDFSAKFTEFSDAFASGKIDDPAWQTQINTLLGELDKAAADLGAVSQAEVPETFKTLDGYLKEIASETPVMSNAIRDAFKEYNAGNSEAAITKLNEAAASAEKISAAADKMNAEVDKYNQ